MVTNKSAHLWSSFLLATAVLFVVFAWCDGFSLLEWLTSFWLMAALVAMVTGSYVAASTIRDLAGLVFHMDEKPWYGQFPAVVFLAAVLIVVVSAYCLIDDIYGDLSAPWAAYQEQYLFLCMACTIVWIILLDWPSPEPSAPQPPAKRHTTPVHITWPSPTTTSTPDVQRRPTPKQTERYPLLDDRTTR